MKKGLLHLLILALAPISVLVPEAEADFYRYVDENGVVHITNAPTSNDYTWIMSEGRAPGAGSAWRGTFSRKHVERLIDEKAMAYGVDPALVRAIVKAESDFDPHAVSPAGARGLMQLMPATARLMGVEDIHDPEENVEGGVRYLTTLLRRFDWSVPLAVAAYNAGETAVLKYGDIPPFTETQDFVKRVLRFQSIYRGLPH